MVPDDREQSARTHQTQCCDDLAASLATSRHASHATDHDATLPEVQATFGHGNIATTSGYLHARPESSSGLKLDPGVFLR